jgi:hypothetical protein
VRFALCRTPTSRKVWALLAVLPVVPLLAFYAFVAALWFLGIEISDREPRGVFLLYALIAAACWLLLLTPLVVIIAASRATKIRGLNPYLVAGPSVLTSVVVILAMVLD